MMIASACRPVARLAWRTALLSNRCFQEGTPKVRAMVVFQSERRPKQTMTMSWPKLHEASRRQASTLSPNAPKCVGEQDLPPISLLNTARKSGALPMTPEAVLDFLREFQTQSASHTPGWQRRACLNHDVDPWTLGLIAVILEKCERPGQKQLGAILLATAAQLGDRASIFKRVYGAIKLRRLHEHPEALRQVGLMAKRDKDRQAMSLLGMALYSQEKDAEALNWLRKATSGSLDFHGAADALVLEGRILKTYDIDGAKVAFQRAASELDDPTACFYLSQMQAAGSVDQIALLTRAASSGIMEACHNLGVMEMAKIDKASKVPRSLNDYGLALDWTLVAAEGGFGLSMLNMALMCIKVGQREEAERWLERAEMKANSWEEAQSVRAKCESEDAVRL